MFNAHHFQTNQKTLWEELKEYVYYWDGSFRDIYILDTTLEDNKKYIDYVNENYPIKWLNHVRDVEENIIDYDLILQYWNGIYDSRNVAAIFLNDVQINNHFFSSEIIENDIHPAEVKSLQDHENIIRYMKDLSILLNKPVILTNENSPNEILIQVFNENITYI